LGRVPELQTKTSLRFNKWFSVEVDSLVDAVTVIKQCICVETMVQMTAKNRFISTKVTKPEMKRDCS